MSPWKVAIILLTLFLLRYITFHPCDLCCYWKFILLNPCNLFPLDPYFSPVWQPPIYSLFLRVCFCFVMVVFVRLVFCVFIFVVFFFSGLLCFSDSTYKWSYMVFVFLWVISFSIIPPRLIHVTNRRISPFLWLNNIPCVYI